MKPRLFCPKKELLRSLEVLIAVSLVSALLIVTGCQSSTSPETSFSTTVMGYDVWQQDYLTIKYDSRGKQLWAARYNGPGNNSDGASAMAVDDVGNVYVTGTSRGTRGNGIREDYATIKYNSSGSELWVARYSGPGGGDNTAKALALDSEGNAYVTGQSTSQAGDLDFATVKYDSQGREIWVARYNGPGNGVDEAEALALDGKGNVYVTGNSRGESGHDDYATIKYDSNGNQMWVVRYNDGSPTAMVVSAGNEYVTGLSRAGEGLHYATVKYDINGNQLWVGNYYGPAGRDNVPYSLAVDSMGNVLVTGRSIGDSYDYATVKYNSQGHELWVARYNGPIDGDDQAISLDFDTDGSIYVTGSSDNEKRDRTYATLKYNTDGKLLWEARYSGPAKSDSMAKSLAVDADRNVFVTGRSQGNSSSWDYATVKYDSKGKQNWVARYNGPGNSLDGATSLATDKEGNVYVTGSSGGTAGIPITTQSPWPDVPIFSDPTQVIQTKTGEEFAIRFDTFTRGGQSWEETHEADFVSRLGTELIMSQSDINGTTWFRFKALKPGKTQISFFDKRRVSEAKPVVFQVDIK